MTLLDIKEITEQVNSHWAGRMPLMAAEEAAEFIQAISKTERMSYWHGDDAYDVALDHLIEEMGDTLIVIGALLNRYGIPAVEVENAIQKKLSEERDV